VLCVIGADALCVIVTFCRIGFCFLEGWFTELLFLIAYFCCVFVLICKNALKCSHNLIKLKKNTSVQMQTPLSSQKTLQVKGIENMGDTIVCHVSAFQMSQNFFVWKFVVYFYDLLIFCSCITFGSCWSCWKI
jgi:hypothetical protein